MEHITGDCATFLHQKTSFNSTCGLPVPRTVPRTWWALLPAALQGMPPPLPFPTGLCCEQGRSNTQCETCPTSLQSPQQSSDRSSHGSGQWGTDKTPKTSSMCWTRHPRVSQQSHFVFSVLLLYTGQWQSHTLHKLTKELHKQWIKRTKTTKKLPPN